MNILLSLLLAVGLLAGPPSDGAPVDGEPKARQGTFALTNARIVTVTNGTIENGTVIIRGDRIVAVGASVDVPGDAEVIDCAGLTIYPGLIDSGTRIGLAEVGSVAETNDFSEVGDLTPQMEALTAVNPNSVLLPVTRVSGVTTALTAPSGGTWPGTAALINLHGYTPQQMLVGDARFMVLNFPATGRRGWWDSRPAEEVKKQAKEAMEKLDDTIERALLYHRIDSAYAANPRRTERPEYVPAMAALLPVVRGEMPLMIEVNAAADIRSAITWTKKNGLDNVIFSGVAEGWRVADELAEAGIPVIAGPTLSNPTRASDRYDRAYANPALLRDAGVKVALRSSESENVRNLPYNAGFAAAYGMGREDALRSVTINAAEMFGVGDQLGSIEEGKKANLVVANGDLFETKTDVQHVFIDGYLIPMSSRQIRLYEEFLEREPGLEKHPQTPPVGTNE